MSGHAFVLKLLHEPQTLDDDNIDAIVAIPGRGRFGITFFTLRNIASLMASHAATGECDGGRWFWAVDMLVVADMRRATLELAVAGALRDGGENFLSRLTPIDED